MLLRYDACASIINGTAQIPRNLTEDDEIITMLEGMERGRGSAAGARRPRRRRRPQCLTACDYHRRSSARSPST